MVPAIFASQKPLHPPLSTIRSSCSLLATGICGTDMYYYLVDKNGIFVIEPLVLGHEAGREAIAFDTDVKDVAVSDRVTVEL